MVEGWVLWAVLVIVAVGVVVAGVALVRLPREEDDVSAAERRTEATWIAGTIEHRGGIAPASLVEEVLDLHGAYLRAPRVPSGTPGPRRPSATPAQPLPPAQMPPPPQPGQAPPPGQAATPPGGQPGPR